MTNAGRPKSAFVSQYAAESWYALKQKENGWTDSQRAYKCPQSSMWHLTTDTETHPAIPVAQVNYKAAANGARGKFIDQIRQLQTSEPHLTVKEVAARIGCSIHRVYQVRTNKTRAPRGAAPPRTANSLSGIADRRRQLSQEMARLDVEEKRLQEEMLPKVQVFGNNGDTQVRITCNHQSLILTLEALVVLKSRLAEVR
jgi:hypothetical protein